MATRPFGRGLLTEIAVRNMPVMHPLDALGNPVRRRILSELRTHALPVHGLADRFKVSRPAISRHLRILQDAGLVEMRERGTQNLYAIRLQGLQPVRAYLDEFWDAALVRLESLAQREDA